MKKRLIVGLALAMMMSSTACMARPVYADEAVPMAYGFESDLQGWEGRGSAKVELTDKDAKEGKSSVYVSGRTANWNGISKDMTKLLKAGKTYTVGAWVKFAEGADSESMSLTLQESLSSSKDAKFVQIANNGSVKKGEWTYVEGNVTLDADSTAAIIYVEATNPELNFYVDQLSVKEKATQKEGQPILQDIPSLKEVYKDYFKIGTAISTRDMTDIDKAAILKHFNSFTCGNELKPENVLDYDATVAYMKDNKGDQVHPQVNFKAAHSSLTFCGENHIPVRGHVLAWHSQTPNWFFKENFSKDPSAPNVSKEVMLQRLENYIKIVFESLQEQYPDVEFYAWDVVNEAINPDIANGLRLPAEVAKTTGDDGNNENQGKSMWMATIGDEFIEKAFEYARKYAPKGVKLTYNDYNECDPKKSEIMYNLCKKLIEQGNLDVIGMQGHYDMTTPSVSQLEATIRKYAALGVEIEITELDVMQTDNSPEGMLKQGYRYKEIFDTLKQLSKEPGIDIGACVLWGTDDGNSWRREKSPLLFDKDYQAKPAYWGAVDASMLDATKQEIKVSKMTSDSSIAWKILKSTPLVSKEGKTLAQMKISWDEENLYVQVIPEAAYKGKEGTIEVWVDPTSDGGDSLKSDDVAKKYTLKEGEQIKIPVAGLKEGGSLGMDVSVAIDKQVATWNNTKYSGKAQPKSFGKANLQKADGYLAASKGTPKLDGEVDDIWKDAPSIDVNQFTVGASGATATAKALWDEDHIYVLVDVKDSKLSKKSSNTYEQDSVEVFIDEDYGKTATYEKGDIQYRVNFDNEHSINGDSNTESFKSVAKVTKEGYQIEFALPHRIAPFTAGQIVGFEVQVNNDENGDGSRDSVANWSDLTGNGWSSTENYGALELK